MLFKINFKFLLEIKINLSILLRKKIWTCSITGCTTTDWFKLVNPKEKRLWEPWNEVKSFMYISWWWISQINSIHWYGFESLFLSSWPIWNSRLWYNQLSNRSNFLSPVRCKGKFPTKISSLSWTSSDILRDNCSVVWSWNMDFLSQCRVLSKMTQPIMHSIPNAILLV